MKNRNLLCVFGGALLLCCIPADRSGWSASVPGGIEQPAAIGIQSTLEQEANQKILTEIFLSSDRKKDLEAIKKAFSEVSIIKVRAQFFKRGNPPENIAIGRNISAPVARLVIQLALQYNQGIKFLLPEKRLAPDYIAIGTSIFDESFQIPIRPEDLKRLSATALTTEQFHELYQQLTTDDRRPPGFR